MGRRRSPQATHRAPGRKAVGRQAALARARKRAALPPVRAVRAQGRAPSALRSSLGAARVPLPCLAMSFLSSPAFRRFLSAPVPVLLYGLLAVASAVGAWHAGWQSGSAGVCGVLALFFAGIVAGELRYFRTGRHG